MELTRYNWIDTTGGPHLVLAEELLPYWRGIDGWKDHRDPSDQSDYARASRVESWLGLIPCHTGQALVLSGDSGKVAWIPDAQGGTLVQPIFADDETRISDALGSPALAPVLEGPTAEHVVFSTSSSGVLRLFNSSERGDKLQDASDVMHLAPGNYRVRAGCFETKSLAIVVRRFSPLT